jgi:5-methylthioadenosine/S-adenosylhomocysteine deaminase
VISRADAAATTGNTTAAPMVIRGGLLLTQDPAQPRVIGDVLVTDGRIAAVGAVPDDATATVIDATGKVVLPGFVDTHRHMWQSLFAQAGFGWDFPTFRRHVQLTWGPRMTAADAYTAELVSALAALDAGTTTVRDESHIQNTPEHADATVAALRTSGIRAVFAHGWPCVDSDAWMIASTRRHPRTLARLRRDVLADDTELVTLGAMLRGPEMADLNVIGDDLALARELNVPASMHVGFGGAAIGRLHDTGLLGPDLLFVHCCDSTDDELHMLADAGATASVASGTEISMPGLGLPATARLLAAGVRTGLSSDTEVCVAGDMFTQMRAAHAASVAEAARTSSAPVTAEQLLTLATRSGAEALHLHDRIGSITVGKDADLIVIGRDGTPLAQAADPAGATVAAATPHDVELVLVRGHVRKHPNLTQPGAAELHTQAEDARNRLTTG